MNLDFSEIVSLVSDSSEDIAQAVVMVLMALLAVFLAIAFHWVLRAAIGGGMRDK